MDMTMKNADEVRKQGKIWLRVMKRRTVKSDVAGESIVIPGRICRPENLRSDDVAQCEGDEHQREHCCFLRLSSYGDD